MSTEIMEKNLSAMEKWYPAFAELIRKEEFERDTIEITVEDSWDGEKIFRVCKDGKKLYLGGKRNATEPIDIWLESLGKVNKQAPVYLFGAGSGAYLKKLIRNTDESVNVVVCEPSISIFLTMLEEIDLSKEIENRPIAFIVEGINGNEFEAVMNKILVIENIEFLKESIHPNYKQLFLEELLKYIKPLQKRVQMMMVNYRTGVKLASGVPINILNNMKYICEGYHTKGLAEVLPRDRAAILVSAGPSLNKNIEMLKKAKNKLFILAVDTAIKPLIKAGIIPDAFCTIDAKKPLDLVEIDGSENIPVLAPSVALNAIVEHQKGKKIFFEDGYAIVRKIYDLNKKEFPYVAIGGSVACVAFSILYKAGFKTIILVGQDLAFTDNKSHADGSYKEKMPEQDTKNMLMVKGNYQDKVPTRGDFKMYIGWFDDYIKGAKEHIKDFRVINATEGGAYIEGTEIQSLEETLAEECKDIESFDFAAAIDGMQSALNEEEKKRAVEYLHTIPDNFETIVQVAQELNKAYKKLEKMGKTGNAVKDGCLKQLKKTKKLTKKIMSMPEYQLIDMTMAVADYVLRSEFFYEGDDVSTEIAEMGRKGVLYSELLGECAALLKQEAESAFAMVH